MKVNLIRIINAECGLTSLKLNPIAVCGGELNMESGQLESPNYPEDYVPNKECVWIITVTSGFQVALKFQSFEVSQLPVY